MNNIMLDDSDDEIEEYEDLSSTEDDEGLPSPWGYPELSKNVVLNLISLMKSFGFKDWIGISFMRIQQ